MWPITENSKKDENSHKDGYVFFNYSFYLLNAISRYFEVKACDCWLVVYLSLWFGQTLGKHKHKHESELFNKKQELIHGIKYEIDPTTEADLELLQHPRWSALW